MAALVGEADAAGVSQSALIVGRNEGTLRQSGCLTGPAILATFRTPEGFTVIKSELVDRISIQNPHLYRQDAEKVVNSIFSEISAAMARGDRVELRGFGAFFVKFREGRTGRNPRTGALVSVGRKAVPFFRSGKEMKSRLNSNAHGSDIDAGQHG
jgi:integration host factor subunit beta